MKKLFKVLLDVVLALLLSHLVYLKELSVFEAIILCVLYIFIDVFSTAEYKIKFKYGKRKNRDNPADCKGVDRGVKE